MRSIKYYFLACGFSLLFSSAMSQLHWVNPLPQGNPLKAVCFTDNQSGFLAGDAGTLLRTVDNGQTWSLIDSTTSNNLNAIHFHNINLGLLAGDKGIILRSMDAGLTWIEQESVTDQQINDILFIDSLTAITVGDRGEITKSVDGGITWYEAFSPSFLHLSSVSFPVDSIGYAVGGDKGLKGIILKTYDKGESWDTLSADFDEHLFAVYFIDSLRGYAAGNYSRIYKTISGGQIWAPLYNPNQGGQHHIRDMIFTDFNTGYSVDNNGNILRTFNAGATWDSLSSNISSPLYTLGVNDEGIIYTAGYGGLISRSTDQGLNWQKVSYGSNLNLVSIDFPLPETGFITGSGGLFRTINWGQQWDYTEVSELTKAVDAHFLDSDIGYVLDVDGYIFKTTDGGESWTEQSTGEKSQSYNAIFMVNSTQGYAVGGGQSSNNSWSIALKTINGENWTSLPVNVSVPLFDVHFINNQDGFICGEDGALIKTSNGGNTWHGITMDTTYKLVDIEFLNDSLGFITGNKPGSSKVFRTTNSGLSWHELFEPQDLQSNEKINGVRFADEVNGFAFGTNGMIYKTINGGDSWFRVKKITNYPFNDLYARGGSDGFIAGLGGTILRMEPVVGIEPLPNDETFSFRISPNPAKGEASIVFQASGTGPTLVRLLDLQGREIKLLLETSLQQGLHKLSFNTSNYPDGIYIISILAGKYRLTEKLIIQH